MAVPHSCLEADSTTRPSSRLSPSNGPFAASRCCTPHGHSRTTNRGRFLLTSQSPRLFAGRNDDSLSPGHAVAAPDAAPRSSMDWEANLAAIIKCTDASLAQQFRQFEDITVAVDEAPPAYDPSGDDVAATYLRETMSAEYRHRQQQEQEQQHARVQTPSYSRVSGAFARESATSAAPATTFSEHFYRRQERKRGAAATGRARDNQRMHRRGSEYELAEEDGQVQDHDLDEPRYATTRATAGGAYRQHMYSSPTYDMAQMMEQVRLSLKLEVDARAAIAERQLSALLQLCKATSEELDRLRVEVCANDRQLHTLDQVQSKIRQELTTQKDIGFHLQSMCGKDESWRMQTENQLLELRQMVAALREQGNSTQTVAQEKLSRSELLVQFNAAMEPIKAQLQANLQHQAQQIADIMRTTSSSSLLLDGVTQKVNRGITEELNELRSDLSALKHHVAKLDIFQDGDGRREGLYGRLPHSKEEAEAKAKEEQQLQEKQMTELRDSLRKELLMLTKDFVDTQTKSIRQTIDEGGSRYICKQDIEHLRSTLEEACRHRCATTMTEVNSQLKFAQEQLRGECKAAGRDTSDRLEKAMQQTASTMTTALDEQVNSWHNKQLEFVKMLEREQKERKQTLDELHEALRKNRHQLEDQLHSLVQENRTTFSQHDSDLDKRFKDMEKVVESAVADVRKETQTTVASLKNSLQAQGSNNTVELEQKLMRLEETIAALSKSTALSTTSSSVSSSASTKDVTLALEKQASVYVSIMENLLQKMQLQLQLQTQSQVQMTMAPSPYHGFWPASPYAASQAPPPPILHLPPPVNVAPAVRTTKESPLASKTVMTKNAQSDDSAPSSGHFHVDNLVPANAKIMTTSIEEPTSRDKSAERVRSAVPVKNFELSSDISTPPTESSCRLFPPPAVVSNLTLTSETKLDQSEQSSEQTRSKEDEAIKRENSLATTAQGAQAEAELAKARVESRRKQEQETKQQRQPLVSIPSGNTQKSLISDKTNTVETGSRRLSVPVVLAVPTPVLIRSASSSTLPGNDAVPLVGAKAMAPTIVPNTLSASSQSTTKVEAIPVPEASKCSPSSQFDTTTDFKPSLTNDELLPPLSPLAKIFARPTRMETDSLNDQDALQFVPSATFSPAINIKGKDSANTASPLTTAASTSGAPVSHVLCGLCRLPVRSDHQTEHEKAQCPKRMVACVSCKLQLPWINLEMHELECKNLQRRMTDSTGTAASLPEPDAATEGGGSLKKCRHCSADVPSLELLEHELNCDKVLKQCPHCLRRQKMSELHDHIENCDCRLVSCPNDCGGKFLQRGIPNHLATRCPRKPTTTNTPGLSPTSRPTYPDASKPPPTAHPSSTSALSGKLECKFCDDEIDASKIQDHELNCDWKPKRCQHCNMVVISRDLLRHETSCKINVKSCPHCNENMPQSALIIHASRCSKRPIKCIRCCQFFPADAIVAHSTNCKFVAGASPAVNNPSPGQSPNSAVRAPIKIPPPPPFPPPSTATTAMPVSQQNTRRASADPQMTTTASVNAVSPPKESASDRVARRNLALSQLTNPGLYSATTSGRGHDEEVGDEEEYDDEDDDDQLTLAQVVKEWSVENVCLWLHEDVGVPDVVLRFQQKQCNGEMLLELTESDLINDFGVKDRVQRERILSAIEAINTSNAFSDEDDEEDEEDEEDEDDEDEQDLEEYQDKADMRHPIGGAAYTHPRDILRRKSQPSPQRLLGGELPSSNDMLCRISSVLENTKR